MQYDLLTTAKYIFFRIKYNFSDSHCKMKFMFHLKASFKC